MATSEAILASSAGEINALEDTSSKEQKRGCQISKEKRQITGTDSE